LIAHKDPVKACWLKEIRQYASDLVALAEHAADDLQVTEEASETKEESKNDEKPVPAKIESLQVNPESTTVESNPAKAAKEAKKNPNSPKADSTKDSTKIVEKRKDSVGTTDVSEVKKTKVEEVDMSRRYSASRYSASSKVVEGEFVKEIT
jgi:hypothetical protein